MPLAQHTKGKAHPSASKIGSQSVRIDKFVKLMPHDSPNEINYREIPLQVFRERRKK